MVKQPHWVLAMVLQSTNSAKYVRELPKFAGFYICHAFTLRTCWSKQDESYRLLVHEVFMPYEAVLVHRRGGAYAFIVE